MSRKQDPRLYQRNGRWWADIRGCRDAGGAREPLVAAGERLATTDRAVAQVLLAARVKHLEAARRGRAVTGIRRHAALQAFAADHLIAKKRANKVTDRWLAAEERQLQRASDFFGADRALTDISVQDVREWLQHLALLPGKRGRALSGGTLRHALNSLSNLYRRAIAEGYVLPGYNPAQALLDKPSARREEARWLEQHEAALLLEAARTYRPKRDDLAAPFIYELVPTFLLTGGRKAEVLGLEVGDVSFDRDTVTFRPHAHRRLKTETSHRVIPLAPQLREILQPYVFHPDRPPTRLLFPSFKTGQEAMVTDFRQQLDSVAHRAGWHRGEITSKMLRHTWCSARLMCVEHGASVSPFRVAKEMGHGGTRLVERIYGHLAPSGRIFPRGEHVEFRVATHREVLADRLRALQ